VGPCPWPPRGCSAAAFSGRSGPRLLGGYSLSRGPFPRPRSRGQVRGECGQPILIPAGAGLLQFGARRGPCFNPGPARPAAPTSYSGNARSLGPFPRHCRHCHERRLVVTRTLEERGGLEPLVHVSLPRLAWTRATRHCRFQPGRVVASGKRSRRTRKKRPRYRGFFRVRSVSSPWGIGVDCAQDCPRLIQRAKGYISGVSIINSMETRKDR